ncbi:hypothetical protein OO013_06635 [Mangrovivirga sp. M17]|uniref:DUF4625 domain-containing protein n=1 Tax=Mangrovivirga halotolerans TaxID=2993936 RepID=A0ABT3RQB5_9BACT|nr:hypothetical protein [Mangrovivirga halotolerans]MCX2743533.1 hypothetical protein [Mangrovivirga halotolerans]
MLRSIYFLGVLTIFLTTSCSSDDSETPIEIRNPEGVVIRNVGDNYFVDIYFDRISVGSNGVLQGTGDYFSFVINASDLSGKYDLSEPNVSVSAIEDFNPVQPDNAVIKFPSQALLTVDKEDDEVSKVTYTLTYDGVEYQGETSSNISEF